VRIRDKARRRLALADRALASLARFQEGLAARETAAAVR
jgi:hypothetical protein